MEIQNIKELVVRMALIDANNDYEFNNCCKELTEILSLDIRATIDFFQNKCSDEDLYWLASIFEDVVKATKSHEFVVALRSRLDKVVPEAYNQRDFQTDFMREYVDYDEYIRHVSEEIVYAEGALIEFTDNDD